MIGSKHQLAIDSLTNSGDGVGRIDGKVVFVPFSCPGDLLEVQITQDKKTFFRAHILEIKKASPHRVTPPCQYFSQCGGCDYQHISDDQQRYWKQHNLLETLARVGQLDLKEKFTQLHTSSQSYHYRNRVQLQLKKNGYFYNRKNSRDLVKIEACEIAANEINFYLKQHPHPAHHGKWELATQNNRVELFAVNEHGQSALGFRQVNSDVNQKLLKETSRIIQEKNIHTLFDIYCGQGNWANGLCEQNEHLRAIGVDINPINIEQAQREAHGRAQYILGKAETIFTENPSLKPDGVLIDPPRAGCSAELIELLIAQSPRYLVYISCHSATLARDLKALVAQGFEVEEVQGFDMFPQTSHLEAWVLLRGASA